MGCACGELDVEDVGSSQPFPGGGLPLAERLGAASARLRAERKSHVSAAGRSLPQRRPAALASMRALRRLRPERTFARQRVPFAAAGELGKNRVSFDGGCHRRAAASPREGPHGASLRKLRPEAGFSYSRCGRNRMIVRKRESFAAVSLWHSTGSRQAVHSRRR